MQVVSQKISVAPNVDWDALAEATEGFSGADLQALVYNAHLEAITSSLETSKNSSDRKGKGKAREDGAAVSSTEEEKPIQYFVVGREDGNAPRSKAEENALQQRVSHRFLSWLNCANFVTSAAENNA